MVRTGLLRPLALTRGLGQPEDRGSGIAALTIAPDRRRAVPDSIRQRWHRRGTRPAAYRLGDEPSAARRLVNGDARREFPRLQLKHDQPVFYARRARTAVGGPSTVVGGNVRLANSACPSPSGRVPGAAGR